MKILANDGISNSGKKKLEAAGYTVLTNKIAQEELIKEVNAQDISMIITRSSTLVRKDLIDACPGLKLIGRGGVGMDNIDVAYAREKGIEVINTPAASSGSVAELVIGQIFSLMRMTFDANRMMPGEGAEKFPELKKKYGKGTELRGKTLGIIGFGRIGQSVAEYALGLGMKVKVHRRKMEETKLKLEIEGHGAIDVVIKPTSLEEVLRESDVITLHVPKLENNKSILDAEAIGKMKKGAYIINSSRGGIVDEDALLDALNSGHIAGAALDVFKNEPTPDKRLLQHPLITATPHIGAATVEAQDRIGEELADQIISKFGVLK